MVKYSVIFAYYDVEIIFDLNYMKMRLDTNEMEVFSCVFSIY